MFDIKLETKKFIENFVNQYEKSDNEMKGDVIYNRMIYECSDYRLILTRTKLYKVLRNSGFESCKRWGVLNFFIKRK